MILEFDVTQDDLNIARERCKKGTQSCNCVIVVACEKIFRGKVRVGYNEVSIIDEGMVAILPLETERYLRDFDYYHYCSDAIFNDYCKPTKLYLKVLREDFLIK